MLFRYRTNVQLVVRLCAFLALKICMFPDACFQKEMYVKIKKNRCMDKIIDCTFSSLERNINTSILR